MSINNLKDMSGHTIGLWTVLSRADRPEGSKELGAWWFSQCSCGNTEVLNGARLRAGRMKRGCLDCAGRRHGKRGTECSPTYNSWRAMRARCLRPDDSRYPDYGGRGIKICDRWMVFANFLADMGERPEGLTLDRIENDGDYEPGNCRWAGKLVQARNSSHFKLSDDQVEAIRRALDDGAVQADLAIIAGVTRSHISNIATGRGRALTAADYVARDRAEFARKSPDIAMREAMVSYQDEEEAA